jgi:thiazole synthase ThiGH ThiG subunit
MLFVHQQDVLAYWSLTLVLARSIDVQGHEAVMPWDLVLLVFEE